MNFPPSGVTVAAKGYFDALVKLGELASDSQGSKELGEWTAGGEGPQLKSKSFFFLKFAMDLIKLREWK